MNKKGNVLGIGIIAMALLLFVGGLFFDDSSTIDKNQNSIGDKGVYGHENYLFYLNEVDFGLQNRVIDNYPNIEIGSRVELNTIFTGNSFLLQANPFTANSFSFDISFTQQEFVNKYLLYFSPDRLSGDQNLKIYVDGNLIYEGNAMQSEIPLVVQKQDNSSRNKITFELDKPSWYSLFNWNKMEIKHLKVLEEKQDTRNNIKEFNFEMDLVDLENVFVEAVISCQDIKESSLPIEVKVNDYIVANQNPSCLSNFNKIEAQVPLNILNEGKNTLELKTDGHYKLAYNINKIYFNDKDVYKFNIENFDEVLDVVMYGDFDKDVIDMRINSHLVSLNRNEIKSIIPYLRFGVNEIKFLTKPIKFEEFIIEKNEFFY